MPSNAAPTPVDQAPVRARPDGQAASRALGLEAARAVVLVQAFETGDTDNPQWTAEDRAWATRCARESTPAGAAPQVWLAQRAGHALQRLAARDARVAALQAPLAWPWGWLAVAALGVFGAGLMVDQIGPAQRISLLAPPVWLLVAWNLAVYAGLGVQLLRSGSTPAGRGRRPWLHRAMGLLWPAPRPGRDDLGVWARFVDRWAPLEASMRLAQAAVALHLAAALLALGVVAGLYLRGLVLDYRVAWESTFLDADTVHRVLAVALAPAQALSGVPVPGAAALQDLRTAPGHAPAGPAAPWIHLYAATLLLFVIGPRFVLAALAAVQAVRQSRRCPLPLNEPYFQALLRQSADHGPWRVALLAHGQALGAAPVLKLRALLQAARGEEPKLEVLPPLPYGEDPGPLHLGPCWVLVLDLAATPEPEVHGRLVDALRNQAPSAQGLVIVDESAWAARMAAYPKRLAERREAWQHWAHPHAVALALVALDAPAPDAASALREALGHA